MRKPTESITARRRRLALETDEERAARLAYERANPTPKQKRALARSRAWAAAARSKGLRAPSQRVKRTPKPVTHTVETTTAIHFHKPRPTQLPAFNQAIPEDPKEAFVFHLLQRDAKVWRDRLSPEMAVDPNLYVHGVGGADSGAYRNTDGSIVTAFGQDVEPDV